jgi:hypothetical protein
VPSYFDDCDALWNLAKALVDPLEDMPAEASEDDSIKILDSLPLEMSSRKRQVRKLKGPLDSRFLCRNDRLKKTCRGFKDATNAVAAETEGVLLADQAEPVVDPISTTTPEVALAIVPVFEGSAMDASTSAPHLPTAVVHTIGTEFLKMHPQNVSDVALLASNDD